MPLYGGVLLVQINLSTTPEAVHANCTPMLSLLRHRTIQFLNVLAWGEKYNRNSSGGWLLSRMSFAPPVDMSSMIQGDSVSPRPVIQPRTTTVLRSYFRYVCM